MLEYMSSAKLLSDGICVFSREFFVISLISEPLPFTIVFNVATNHGTVRALRSRLAKFFHLIIFGGSLLWRGVILIRFVVICSFSTSLEVDIVQRVLVFAKT